MSKPTDPSSAAKSGLRDSALLFIGAWCGMVLTLVVLGLTGAIK